MNDPHYSQLQGGHGGKSQGGVTGKLFSARSWGGQQGWNV